MKAETRKLKAESQKLKAHVFSFQFSVLSFSLTPNPYPLNGLSYVEDLTPVRRAFSLVELMIAIMILGIGLTMVATVFPIGLDIARETMQTDISMGVADAAVATVRLSVPGWKSNLANPDEPLAVNAANRVLLPDVYDIELTTNLAGGAPNGSPPPDTAINVEEEEVLLSTPPFYFSAWNGWFPTPPPPTQTQDRFIDRCRVYTERTGWDAELSPMGNGYVLPGQNIPADNSAILVSPLLPTFRAFGQAAPIRADMVRIHLADSVYPPVDVVMPDGTTPNPNMLKDIADRKYSWSIIHRLISPNGSGRQIMLMIVITHRGEPGSRYARQEPNSTPPPVLDFDLNVTADADKLREPKPDPGTTTDMQFPQPWLVVLDSGNINLTSGEIRCTAELAQLLPAGSFFIIASSVGAFEAITVRQVLTVVSGDLADTPINPSATLQIAAGGGSMPATSMPIPVWVFPPAIERGSNRFSTRSPIVYKPIPRGVPSRYD